MEQYLPLREVQLVEYGILCKVAEFLEKNNMEYILCGGTMLGAVRHNGFIPWDDDIDILVPRDDYDRLLSLMRENRNQIEGIHLCLPGDKNHVVPFIKAIDPRYSCVDTRMIPEADLHVWLDIFPMDHFPDDEKRHKACLQRLITMRNILYSGTLTRAFWKEHTKGRPLHRAGYEVYSALYHLLGGYEKLSCKIDQYARKMDRKYRDSHHVGDGAWPLNMKDYFPLEAVTPSYKHPFEDGMFNIPQNYDLYLTHFYGDYMTPPPEDKRGGHHIQVYLAQQKPVL